MIAISGHVVIVLIACLGQLEILMIQVAIYLCSDWPHSSLTFGQLVLVVSVTHNRCSRIVKGKRIP